MSYSVAKIRADYNTVLAGLHQLGQSSRQEATMAFGRLADALLTRLEAEVGEPYPADEELTAAMLVAARGLCR